MVMARALSDFGRVEKRVKNDVFNGVLSPEQGALQFRLYADGMAKVMGLAEDEFEMPHAGWTALVDRVTREIEQQ